MIPAPRGTLRSHVTLSLGASAVSIAVTLVTLPYVVNGIGLAEYGLFVLLALASAYVGILDFGFSWTTSRYVADAIEREDSRLLDDILAASIALYFVLAVVGGVVLALAAPALVRSVFNVEDRLVADGVDAARIFALAFPAAMAQTYAASLLRGAQRFDLTTALQGAAAIATAVGTAAAVATGAGVVGVSATVAAVQIFFGLAGLVVVRTVFQGALRLTLPKRSTITELGRFSGTVAMTNLGGQLLYLPNRMAVGVLLPLEAVARFAVPLSLAQRLQVVPSSIASAALPTLTAASARSDSASFRHSFWRLALANAALLGPVSALAVVWAPTILTVWISDDLGAGAPTVLRLAIVAILLNAVSSILIVACDSAGAPGVPAIATLTAGVANVVLSFALTSMAGLTGAALALVFSIGLLVVLIASMIRRAGLPDLMSRPAVPIRPAAAAVAVVAAAGWTALAWMSEHWIDDRASLAFWTCAWLGIAYAGLLSAFGRPLLGPWNPFSARART